MENEALNSEAGNPSGDEIVQSAQSTETTVNEQGSSGDVNAALGRLKREFPETLTDDGSVRIPSGVLALAEKGIDITDAYRLYESGRRAATNTARAAEVNDVENLNRAASTGSLAGGDAVRKDFYSSQEWDRLPAKIKENFIRSGKVYEFMKKWSEKQ